MLTPPLSIQLRNGTKDHHRLAETTPFIQSFFKGNFSLEEYRLFLVQLFHVYHALEINSIDYSRHPLLKTIFLEELKRTQPLAHDLDHYFGDSSWNKVAVNIETSRYVDRIHQLEFRDNYLLVAHAYTRYLGDLSGGQAMKKILLRSYPQETRSGVNFYEFSQIDNHTTYKEQYRTRLDSLPMEQHQADAIVAEAQTAFNLNRQMTDSLLNQILI